MDFTQFSLLLVVAAFSGIIAKRLKQPLLVGYLFAGFVLAYLGLLKDHQLVDSLGKIGVALLLFLVGLDMNLKELPTIGKVAIYTGIGQIVFTSFFGFILGMILGFSVLASIYIALAVSFSSTIIIVKLLSEKNTLDSLYGKISVGILLVQDFVAIAILIFLAGVDKGGIRLSDFFIILLKAVILFAVVWFLSKKVLPKFFEKHIVTSPDLTFIVSIAWALGLSSFVAGSFGFSLEIGGFLAGLALSNLPEHLEISSRTRPLRDFFLTLFFMSLGANLLIDNFSEMIFPAVILSTLVLVGKPIIVMGILGFMKFKKRTSFLASVAVAQISEFSLVVVAMGVSLGHIEKNYLALTVIVAAITMTISTYLILDAEKIYVKIKDMLSIFERRNPMDLIYLRGEKFKDHIVLVGCLRTGLRLIPFFKKKNIPYVVVDFNPDVYDRLTADNNPVIFGDITDAEILEATQMENAKLVISTINGLSDNLIVLEYIKRMKNKPLSLFTTVTRRNALKLYEKGADYVIVPEIVAGEHIRNLLKIYGLSGKRLKKAGQNHFNRLLYT